MTYVLVDKDSLILHLGNLMEETDNSFIIDNTVFFKEEGMVCHKVEGSVNKKIKPLEYKYVNGKFTHTESLLTRIKKILRREVK